MTMPIPVLRFYCPKLKKLGKTSGKCTNKESKRYNEVVDSFGESCEKFVYTNGHPEFP